MPENLNLEKEGNMRVRVFGDPLFPFPSKPASLFNPLFSQKSILFHSPLCVDNHFPVEKVKNLKLNSKKGKKTRTKQDKDKKWRGEKRRKHF